MDDFLSLLEDLAALHNKALALGINLDPFTTEAGKRINDAHDERFAEDRARILQAFCRPATDSVQ